MQYQHLSTIPTDTHDFQCLRQKLTLTTIPCASTQVYKLNRAFIKIHTVGRENKRRHAGYCTVLLSEYTQINWEEAVGRGGAQRSQFKQINNKGLTSEMVPQTASRGQASEC